MKTDADLGLEAECLWRGKPICLAILVDIAVWAQ